jgi:hypothetical protein
MGADGSDGRRSGGKVVPFPGDWIGPRDDLVPLGATPRAGQVQHSGQDCAPAGHEDRARQPLDADSFWGEDSASLHEPMRSSGDLGGERLQEDPGAIAAYAPMPPHAAPDRPSRPRLQRPGRWLPGRARRHSNLAPRARRLPLPLAVGVVALGIVAIIGTALGALGAPARPSPAQHPIPVDLARGQRSGSPELQLNDRQGLAWFAAEERSRARRSEGRRGPDRRPQRSAHRLTRVSADASSSSSAAPQQAPAAPVELSAAAQTSAPAGGTAESTAATASQAASSQATSAELSSSGGSSASAGPTNLGSEIGSNCNPACS